MLGTEDGADTRKGWKVRKGESQVPEEGMFLFFLVFFFGFKGFEPTSGCFLFFNTWMLVSG